MRRGLCFHFISIWNGKDIFPSCKVHEILCLHFAYHEHCPQKTLKLRVKACIQGCPDVSESCFWTGEGTTSASSQDAEKALVRFYFLQPPLSGLIFLYEQYLLKGRSPWMASAQSSSHNQHFMEEARGRAISIAVSKVFQDIQHMIQNTMLQYFSRV